MIFLRIRGNSRQALVMIFLRIPKDIQLTRRIRGERS